MTTVTLTIASSSDDKMETITQSGVIYDINPNHVRSSAADHRMCALLFSVPSMTLAQGDTINDAQLYLTVADENRDSLDADVFAEKVASAGAVSNTQYTVSNRADANPTTASYHWSFNNVGEGPQTSPTGSLTDVIQEVVSLLSWDGLTILVFIDPRNYTGGEFLWFDEQSAELIIDFASAGEEEDSEGSELIIENDHVFIY